MPKPFQPPGTPEDTEQAFYDALQQGDVDRLMACWSEEDEIVCIHPGGPRLVGREAIRASFERLFAQGGLSLTPQQPHRIEPTVGTRVSSVVERLEVMGDDGLVQAWVLATHVYAKTALGWRLVVHHASPATADEPAPALAHSQRLH